MPRAKGIVGVRWEESTPRAESPTVAEAVLLKRRQASSWNQLAAWRCFAHPFVSNLPVKAALPLFPFSPHTQKKRCVKARKGAKFQKPIPSPLGHALPLPTHLSEHEPHRQKWEHPATVQMYCLRHSFLFAVTLLLNATDQTY